MALAHENPGLYFDKAGDFQRQANEAISAMKPSRSTEQMKTANKDILAFPGKQNEGLGFLPMFRIVPGHNCLLWTATVARKDRTGDVGSVN